MDFKQKWPLDVETCHQRLKLRLFMSTCRWCLKSLRGKRIRREEQRWRKAAQHSETNPAEYLRWNTENFAARHRISRQMRSHNCVVGSSETSCGQGWDHCGINRKLYLFSFWHLNISEKQNLKN